MAAKHIAVLVGSLRKESFNKMLAKELINLAPPSLQGEIVEIGQLPLYNQDSDTNPPEVYVAFRKKINSFAGVLFVTPEYNRSVPGVLKNAIDVGSRPYGSSVWNAKPGAVISSSMGAIGGFGANHHLRQMLTFLNVPCMQQPEAYLSAVNNLFDPQGNITKEETKAFLKKFMDSFANWVERNHA